MEQTNQNFGFCTSCGAALTGGAFCAACGAKVVAAAATTPVEEAAPAAQPVPAAEPIAPAKAFPLVPVILTGVAALMAFIAMCGRFTFLTFMEFSCLSALIVGMIVFKKDKNLIVSIGFLALALFGMISGFVGFSNNIRYGLGAIAAIITLMFSSVTWLCDAAIGVTYLLAKPKLALVKTLACAAAVGFGFLTMIVSLIVMRGNGAGSLIFTFLLQTTTLYAGALLYTPYKK